MDGVIAAKGSGESPARPTPKRAKKSAKAAGKSSTADSAPGGVMFMGNNVHYDAAGHLLCTSSAKDCNSRPINGYAFCKSHILEDKTAPYIRCEAMPHGRPCNYGILISLNTRYCGIHRYIETKKAGTPVPDLDAELSPSLTPAPMTSAPTTAESQRENPLLEWSESESDDEITSYVSDLEDFDDPASRASLFPSLTNLRYFGKPDDTEPHTTEDDANHLGSPNFNLQRFLEARSSRLSKLIKRYRMKMILLQLSYDENTNNLAMFRARQVARLGNELDNEKHDRERRAAMLEKLYFRKVTENPKKNNLDSKASGGDAALGESKIVSKLAAKLGVEASVLEAAKSTLKFKSTAATPKTRVARVGPCIFPGCTEQALPITPYCYCHILNDPNQKLFVQCDFRSTGPTEARCTYPVIRNSNPQLCAYHQEITSGDEDQHVDIDEDQHVDIED